MPRFLVFVAAACLAVTEAKTGPHTGAITDKPQGGGTGSNPKTVSTGTAGHHGPFEDFARSIGDNKKKSLFFSKLKKLKEGGTSRLPPCRAYAAHFHLSHKSQVRVLCFSCDRSEERRQCARIAEERHT